jgi:hypothetical protein
LFLDRSTPDLWLGSVLGISIFTLGGFASISLDDQFHVTGIKSYIGLSPANSATEIFLSGHYYLFFRGLAPAMLFCNFSPNTCLIIGQASIDLIITTGLDGQHDFNFESPNPTLTQVLDCVSSHK